uniref:Uncharacterized protein n=1 Tax=Photinus pyralis TaxID=7054 RepID=A0A1Y1M106_PHOPY
MTIEVNHRDGPIGAVDGPQKRQGDGMVSAKGDDTGQSPPLDCRASFISVCGGGSGQDLKMSFLNLLESPCVVVRCDWNITAVEDSGPAVERICFEWDVVAAV